MVDSKSAGSGKTPAQSGKSKPASNQAPKKDIPKTTPPKPSSSHPPASTNSAQPPKAAPAKTSPAKADGSDHPPTKRPAPPESNNDSKKPSQTFCPGTVTMRLFTRSGAFKSPATDQQKEKPGPVADNGTKTAMAHCFHLALALLERSTGHDAFINVALRTVRRRREIAEKEKKPEVGLFAGIAPEERHKEIPKQVNIFLSKIRHDGIPVCITAGLKDSYGLTHRWNWGDSMDQYEPVKAAIIYLHKGMIEGLLLAAQAVDDCMTQRRKVNEQIQKNPKKAQDPAIKEALEELPKRHAYAQMSFERAIFCVSVTLAHELVHAFTGYLTGRIGPDSRTPPNVEAPFGPYGKAEHGEAGWDWCEQVFSGLAHFWYPKGSPDQLTSGYYIGVPVLMELIESKEVKWQEKSMMYAIDHAMVKKIIEMKDWESAYKSDRNWMHKVRKQGDKGLPYKEWYAKYREVVRIWDKYYGSPDDETKAAKAVAMGALGDMAFASTLKAEQQITKPLAAGDLITVKA